jgi:hypothetical protein
MQNQTAPAPHGVPESFYNKFGQKITAVLSGFDRIRFRATLRMLYEPAMMDRYLAYCGVGLNKFKAFAEATTARIKTAAYDAAARAGRPLEYLRNNQLSKEDLAREVAQLWSTVARLRPTCWSLQFGHLKVTRSSSGLSWGDT